MKLAPVFETLLRGSKDRQLSFEFVDGVWFSHYSVAIAVATVSFAELNLDHLPPRTVLNGIYQFPLRLSSREFISNTAIAA
jgi:hypothetical protein